MIFNKIFCFHIPRGVHNDRLFSPPPPLLWQSAHLIIVCDGLWYCEIEYYFPDYDISFFTDDFCYWNHSFLQMATVVCNYEADCNYEVVYNYKVVCNSDVVCHYEIICNYGLICNYGVVYNNVVVCNLNILFWPKIPKYLDQFRTVLYATFITGLAFVRWSK